MPAVFGNMIVIAVLTAVVVLVIRQQIIAFLMTGAAHLFKKRLFHDIVLQYNKLPCNSITFG